MKKPRKLNDKKVCKILLAALAGFGLTHITIKLQAADREATSAPAVASPPEVHVSLSYARIRMDVEESGGEMKRTCSYVFSFAVALQGDICPRTTIVSATSKVRQLVSERNPSRQTDRYADVIEFQEQPVQGISCHMCGKTYCTVRFSERVKDGSCGVDPQGFRKRYILNYHGNRHEVLVSARQLHSVSSETSKALGQSVVSFDTFRLHQNGRLTQVLPSGVSLSEGKAVPLTIAPEVSSASGPN